MKMKVVLKELIKEYEEDSHNDTIQMYVDIIDGLDKQDGKRQKYIDVLKDKYNYTYVEGFDESFIENANLTDIIKLDDFRSFSNYKIYSKKLLRLRESNLNINYSKFYRYSPSSINKEELTILLKKYKITSYFTKTGSLSSPSGSKNDMAIDWAGDTFDKSHILHELAHFIGDDKLSIPTTYSLTDYGLSNPSECTADSIMLYLLNTQYYKQLMPDIAKQIESAIPKWLVNLSKELLKY